LRHISAVSVIAPSPAATLFSMISLTKSIYSIRFSASLISCVGVALAKTAIGANIGLSQIEMYHPCLMGTTAPCSRTSGRKSHGRQNDSYSHHLGNSPMSFQQPYYLRAGIILTSVSSLQLESGFPPQN
jgi:hypothetical protein